VKPASHSSKAAVSPAREAAFDILLRVEVESSYASELLHSRTYASLKTLDHALAMELVMGVLRWQSALDSVISQASSQPLRKLDPEILIALRLGVYQLRWLSRIPARAAIHESVELVKRARKRSAAPFVNGVLRRISAGQSNAHTIHGDNAETLAESSAHPSWLVERWVQDYGLEAAHRICEHDQHAPVTAIRVRHTEAEASLLREGIELERGALLASARVVRMGDITKTTAYESGWCVIQDEASQLVALLAGHGERVLDCCAAPGGKTLALADRNPEASVVAVEIHAHRARLLVDLLGARDATVAVVAADAGALPFATQFDLVLTDVPCSGTGTLSRNPEIKWQLKLEDLADLHKRQLAILRSAMNQVSYGGRLIYSTCSLEHEENEGVVEAALAEDRAFRVVACGEELSRLRGELVFSDLGSLVRGPYLRTLPGVHPCDGFFAAVLEKTNPGTILQSPY
jgi:16S rRNA (cytosine967-C5)-methyltransferase